MSVQSGQSITVLFTTRVFSTGVGTNADSLPTGTLYVNGTANAATVTVTNVSAGLYKAAVTLPTLAIKDEVQLVIAATVSSISDSAVIWTDTKDIALDSSGDVTFNNTSIGSVTGSVGSISGVTFPTNFAALGISAGGHISNVDTLTTYTGNTPQTGDSYARLGAPAGLSIAADIAEIEAETDGIAAIPTSNPSATTIAGAVWDALTSAHTVTGSYGLLVATDLDAAVSSRLATSGYTTPPTAAQNATAVWTDATAGDFTTAGTPGKILVGQLGGTFTTNTSSVFTVAALANGPSGSGSTPAAIASAVWEDLTSGGDFTTAGSIGKLLAAIKLDGSGNAYSVDQFGNQLASSWQVSNIAVTGAVLNDEAGFETVTTGTETNTYINTHTLDGVYHTITPVGNAVDITYRGQFTTTGAKLTGVTWDGYIAGVGNSATVYLWNFINAGWDTVGSILGISNATVSSAEFDATNAHTDSAGNWKVRIAGSGWTGGTLNTDRLLAGYAVVLTPPTNWSSMAISPGGNVTVGSYASGQDPYTLVMLPANGIETGVSPKQALQRIGATTAGKLSGAQSGNPATESFLGLDGATTRVVVTADSSGNRTNVVYS